MTKAIRLVGLLSDADRANVVEHIRTKTDGQSVAMLSWSAAMQDYSQCLANEQEYDRTVCEPAYQADGDNMPYAIDNEMGRLVGLRANAEDRLIDLAAPDLFGVIWKIDRARERWQDFCGWPDSWWESVMQDLHRFAAEGRV